MKRALILLVVMYVGCGANSVPRVSYASRQEAINDYFPDDALECADGRKSVCSKNAKAIFWSRAESIARFSALAVIGIGGWLEYSREEGAGSANLSLFSILKWVAPLGVSSALYGGSRAMKARSAALFQEIDHAISKRSTEIKLQTKQTKQRCLRAAIQKTGAAKLTWQRLSLSSKDRSDASTVAMRAAQGSDGYDALNT